MVRGKLTCCCTVVLFSECLFQKRWQTNLSCYVGQNTACHPSWFNIDVLIKASKIAHIHFRRSWKNKCDMQKRPRWSDKSHQASSVIEREAWWELHRAEQAPRETQGGRVWLWMTQCAAHFLGEISEQHLGALKCQKFQYSKEGQIVAGGHPRELKNRLLAPLLWGRAPVERLCSASQHPALPLLPPVHGAATQGSAWRAGGGCGLLTGVLTAVKFWLVFWLAANRFYSVCRCTWITR